MAVNQSNEDYTYSVCLIFQQYLLPKFTGFDDCMQSDRYK